MNLEMNFAPVHQLPGSPWSRLGDLVEDAACAGSIMQARAAVASWLETHVGTSATFIGRLEEGPAASYIRHTPPRILEGLFANADRYVGDIERFTMDVAAERGAVAYVLEDEAARPLVDEVLLPTHARVGVMATADVGKRPTLRAFFGHERVSTEDRAIITASLRILAMAELAQEPPASAIDAETRSPRRRSNLTDREREVLEYLALGYTNAEIAMACGNTTNTVKKQIGAIFSKLGASTRSECVRLAILEGHVMRNRY